MVFKQNMNGNLVSRVDESKFVYVFREWHRPHESDARGNICTLNAGMCCKVKSKLFFFPRQPT